VVVGPALQGVDRWCDILILHLNIKQCRAGAARPAEVLQLVVGAKHDARSISRTTSTSPTGGQGGPRAAERQNRSRYIPCCSVGRGSGGS
jgi:hypothetical protein